RQDHDGFGAGRARNLRARAPEAEQVPFLDSDGIAPLDFLKRLVKRHELAPRSVVIGRRVHLLAGDLDPRALAMGAIELESLPQERREDFRSVLSRRTSRWRRTDEGYRAFVSSNVSLPLPLFHEIGGFDERFRRWSAEDTELGWRLWQGGVAFSDGPDNAVYPQRDADTARGRDGRRRARGRQRGV